MTGPARLTLGRGSSARELAARLDAGVLRAEVQPRQVTEGPFVIRTPDRDALAAYRRERGIETLIHFPIPTHLQKAYESLGQGPGSCPNAEKACGEVLSLPLYPALSTAAVERVADAIHGFYRPFA